MKRIATNCILASAALLLLSAAPALADNYSPTLFSSAVVDGDSSEWNLAQDFFANMHRAGKADKPLESKLYLRYDCLTQTMYVLVLAVPGVPVLVDGDAWVAINAQNNKVVNDSSGDDGIAPDFAFIGVGYDADPNHAQGYEASFSIAPGTYNLIVHVNVFDAGLGQTSATIGFPGSGPTLAIACTPLGTEHTTWGRVKSLMVQ
ncbi:MAG: hypothetical protein SGI90_14200 [Candidatus Eisenbacteria bacterium]|nr:hypothetical protein [Candidatus Eisenbacteria bacterium]